MKFKKGDKVVVVSLNEIEKDTYYTIGDCGVVLNNTENGLEACLIDFNSYHNKGAKNKLWHISARQLKLAEDQPQQIDPVFLKKIISELLDLQQEIFKMFQRKGVSVPQEVLFKWNNLNSLIREKILGE